MRASVFVNTVIIMSALILNDSVNATLFTG